MNNWNFKNNTTKDAITGYEDVMEKNTQKKDIYH